MFVGKQDDLGTPEVGRWTLDRVNHTTVYYNELDNHNHFTSSVGIDMSFVNDIIMLLDAYSDISKDNDFVSKEKLTPVTKEKTLW